MNEALIQRLARLARNTRLLGLVDRLLFVRELARHGGANRLFARRHPGFAVPPAASFDAVYALSVFTHLDARGWEAWIHELARVTREGGFLPLTGVIRLCHSGIDSCRISRRGTFPASRAPPADAPTRGAASKEVRPDSHARGPNKV